jgi:hypothetical protein
MGLSSDDERNEMFFDPLESQVGAGDMLPWQLMRLSCDIMTRWYHDQGAEAVVNWTASCGPEIVIRTPHCQRGDRVLGRLHEVAAATREAAQPSWSSVRRRVLAALSVDSWEVRGHKGCFHRRGKARADLALEVASRLGSRLADGRVTSADSSYLARAPGGDRDWGLSPEDLRRVGPPRHYAVLSGPDLVALVRTDGQAATPGRLLDLERLWRAGCDAKGLASALRSSVEAESSPVAAAARHQGGVRP